MTEIFAALAISAQSGGKIAGDQRRAQVNEAVGYLVDIAVIDPQLGKAALFLPGKRKRFGVHQRTIPVFLGDGARNGQQIVLKIP